jgi:hypothetical protein
MKACFNQTFFMILLAGLAPFLAAQELPKEMVNMMKFIGRWEAPNAVLKSEGKEYKFTYYTDFEQTAGGSGILMHEWADVPEMGKFDGQNLIGYDPYSKRLYWYSVDNMGTTHDHTCQWKSDNEMYMEHNSIRDGKPFKEQGTAIFRDPNTIEFSIVETLDGKENGTLKALFKKKT